MPNRLQIVSADNTQTATWRFFYVCFPERHLNKDSKFGIIKPIMKFNRRDILKVTGFGIAGMVLLPRMAFAARNSLRSLRKLPQRCRL